MTMDAELTFWIIAAVVGVVAFGVLWLMAKKTAEGYVEVREEWK